MCIRDRLKPQINQDAVRLIKDIYNIDMEKTQYSKLMTDIPTPDIAVSYTHLDVYKRQELIKHGVAKDESEAAKKAIEAGCDIDMMTACYANHLSKLVDEGKLDIKYIDEAALRVLKLKNDLGLFENPYRGANEDDAKKFILAPDFRKKAREAVSKSCVLLKNDNNILPLNKDTKIALIGPYSDSKELCGMWSFTVDTDERCV